MRSTARVWPRHDRAPKLPALTADLTVDVAVVGGGIAVREAVGEQLVDDLVAPIGGRWMRRDGDGARPPEVAIDAGGGGHTVSVNRGPVPQGANWVIQWAAPAAVDPGTGTAWNFDLASERTHLADMDGDGLADLVHKTADETVFFFPNRGRVAWGERRDRRSTKCWSARCCRPAC